MKCECASCVVARDMLKRQDKAYQKKVELAIKLSKYVHDTCGKYKDVPHDIGLKLVEIIDQHNN